MSRSEDSVRLRPMLEAAREAMSFIQGQSRKALDSNRMLVLSLVKCIEIIGEPPRGSALRRKPNTPAFPG